MSYQSLLFVLVGDVLFSFPLLAIHKQNLQWTWETRHENNKIVPVRGYCRINVYERPVQLTLRSLGLETQRELLWRARNHG